MNPEIINVLLVGNSGVGKSYLLNSIGGNFLSGFNAVQGLTKDCTFREVTIGESTVRLVDVPGLLDAADEDIRRNAKEITKGLRLGGRFKLIFVLPANAGRVRRDDLYTIGNVMSAIKFSIDAGIIINKVPDGDQEKYEDVATRETILQELNKAANGRLLRQWYTAIPQYRENDPNGPRLHMVRLLTEMMAQRISKVDAIKAKLKEYNYFMSFVGKLGELVDDLWTRFREAYKNRHFSFFRS